MQLYQAFKQVMRMQREPYQGQSRLTVVDEDEHGGHNMGCSLINAPNATGTSSHDQPHRASETLCQVDRYGPGSQSQSIGPLQAVHVRPSKVNAIRRCQEDKKPPPSSRQRRMNLATVRSGVEAHMDDRR